MPRLLVLTDRSQLPLGRPLLDTVRACVRAGAEAVVVRELDEPYAVRAALVREVAAMGARAIAAHEPLPGCAGVHLPAGCNSGFTAPHKRRSAGEVRRTLGCSRVGRSCHSAAEVHAAAADGAAWATLSPYADSRSKPGRTPLAAAQYADAAGAGIPVYALGGVTAANAAAAVEAGAHGVAVMGEVMRAADPAAVVRALLEAIA